MESGQENNVYESTDYPVPVLPRRVVMRINFALCAAIDSCQTGASMAGRRDERVRNG